MSEFSINHYDYPTFVSRYKHLTEDLGIVKYEGWALASATNSDLSWFVRRTVTLGGNRAIEWALSGLQKASWDNRASYFGPAPTYVNIYSTDFDGINDYVLCGGGGIYDFERNQSFSLSCWINIDSLAALSVLLGKRLSAGNFTGYAVQVLTSGQIGVVLANTAVNWINLNSAGGIGVGVWANVIVTYNGSSTAAGVSIYINGFKDTTVVVNDALSASIKSAGLFCIGARNGATTFINGKIDECSVWNKELDQNDVDEIYGLGKPTDLASHPSLPNLQSWWRMGDDTVFPNITDVVNGFTGLCVNMAGPTNFVTDVPS